MIKKLLLVTLLVCVICTQDKVNAGGYTIVNHKDLKELQTDDVFIKVLAAAKSGFLTQKKVQLGQLLFIQTQVVAGINYKMTFKSQIGIYEIIVFAQSWTDTYKVTSMQKIADAKKPDN